MILLKVFRFSFTTYKNNLIKGVFLFFACTLLCVKNIEANATDSSKSAKLIPLPLIYYTPETNWAFGVSITALKNMGSDSQHFRPSTLGLHFVYTLNKQSILYVPYQIFLSKSKWLLNGELGFSNFPYLFFGVRNETLQEKYTSIQYRALAKGLYAFKPNRFLGLKYHYENQEVTDFSDYGYFFKYPNQTNAVVSGFGITYFLDNRNHILYPTNGYTSELTFTTYPTFLGSSSFQNRLNGDISWYEPMIKGKENLVWANQINVSFVTQNAPFFILGSLGGMRRMRGYLEGYIRDNNILLYQSEFRYKFNQFFGVTLFGSTALTGTPKTFLNLSEPLLSGGAGLRFQLMPENKMHLRLDAAISDVSIKPIWYFTLGEAF